jgi:hypothetical protein
LLTGPSLPFDACLQAGFLPTVFPSLLFTAQLAHILRPHLTTGALCSRVLMLSALPCLASFFLDARHRTRFLRASTRAPGDIPAKGQHRASLKES